MIGSGDVCKWPAAATWLSWTMKITEEEAVDIVETIAAFSDPARGKFAFDRCESPAERLFLFGGIYNNEGVRLVLAPTEVRAKYGSLGLVGQLQGAETDPVPWLFQQFEVADYRADFCIPCSRVLVEIDGHDFHSSKQQLGSDKKRDRQLVADGWRVLRFTGSQVYANPYSCFREMYDCALATMAPLEQRTPLLIDGLDLATCVSKPDATSADQAGAAR